LDDPYLRQAVKETNAVVFLDTAARFMKTNDENSAAQNRTLVDDVIALQAAGAVCVVLNHHATKASAKEDMTLENMLRGTGDFAAMCDVAYGIRKDRDLFANGNGPMEIDLISLKDRELIGSLTRIRLAASRVSDPGNVFPTTSIIHEIGNFRVVSDVETWKREADSLESLVSRNPDISIRSLALEVGISEYRVETRLQKAGWHRVRGGKGGSSPWHKDEEKPCPYAKDAEPKKSAPSTSTSKTSKAPKPGIEETVTFLQRELAGTSPDGEYVTEAEVLVAAEKLGITDRLLNKARKVLGVVESLEDGVTVWSLPGVPQARHETETVAA
jgi:hypothetical protein